MRWSITTISSRSGKIGWRRRYRSWKYPSFEPLDSRGYRATSLAGVRVVAEAPTREGALEQVHQQVSQQLEGEIVRLQVPVPGEANPLLEVIGRFKDHPDWDELQENIRRYREEVDRDPNRL